MQTKTAVKLSKTTVNRAIEIAKEIQANAVIVEVMIGKIPQQMAVSAKQYLNRDLSSDAKLVAMVDPSGSIS